jgi:3'(2'), 5'-bisphosphate nucleotidase
LIFRIIHIAKKAGEAILEEYGKSSVVNWKSDDSPLTIADKRSHNLIQKELKNSFPDIPLMSEEGSEELFEKRKNWEKFWCVDSMDGTKEFIKKSGQFTVNIALIENNIPILGVIYAPVLNLLYFAELGVGAFKWDMDSSECPVLIKVRSLNINSIDIVASKDHAGPDVKKMIDNLTVSSLQSMGSSLKFCLVAEGQADIYYRDVPTYEWDTAAAQAIVTEAGGQVCTLDGNPLQYNKQNLLNPSLITFGSDPEFWLTKV